MRINLHWGISNLLVLTIIEAMLGTTQFALAAAHKPSLSDVLCNDSVTPCVQPPPRDIHYRLSYRAHVTAGNMFPPGGKATPAQLLTLHQ
jgi:hypothetical protein